MTGSTRGDAGRSNRAQLVLVAAAVIAVGLAPIALAYVQLGAGPDRGVAVADRADGADVTRALDRAVYDAAGGIHRNHTWSEREVAVAAVEERLEPRLETLRTSKLRDGVVHEIRYNESAARAWAEEGCPGGPDRQFGDCEAIGGVVVQDRAGRTHVLGVAVNLRVTGEQGESQLMMRSRTMLQSANMASRSTMPGGE